jgi:hypothetical protein
MLSLPQPFLCRLGVPTLRRVAPEIFTRRYFTHCLECGFCNDQCCSYGVDVDLRTFEGIQRHADELEAFTGIPRHKWFRKAKETDRTVPGGGSIRTRVQEGRCVFLSRSRRGCLLHAFALERSLDYHDVKSMVDCLFPLSWEDDALCVADEVEDGTLVCLDTGPSLYRGARKEIAYYFGEQCVEALDTIEESITERA